MKRAIQALGQFRGVTAVAGYYAPSDGYQHVIVATADGNVQEIYFKGGGQPKATDILEQVQGVTAVAGYYAPSDGYQHVIVATADDVQEVYFKGGGQPKATDILGEFRGVTAVAGYYAPSDGYQHVIVATADGNVQEIYFKGGGQPKATDILEQVQGVTAVAGYYAPSDGYQHVIVATADDVQEVYFKGGGQPKATDILGEFRGVTAVAGYYAPSDGYQHVIVATADGNVHEIYFEGGGQPKTTDTIGGVSAAGPAAGYYADDDGDQHVIVSTAPDQLTEIASGPRAPRLPHVNWSAIGPAPEFGDGVALSGRVNAMAISQDIDGHGTHALFLGTAGGGVWRSTGYASAAPTWSPLTDTSSLPVQNKLHALAIGSLAIDPRRPRIVYAGTGDAPGGRYGDGILKSIDGGDTWAMIGTDKLANSPGIAKILIDPSDPSGNTLFAAGGFGVNSPYRGIYASTDGGASWQQRQANMPSNAKVTDLEYSIDLNSRVTLYAGLVDTTPGAPQSGIWQSQDGAATWNRMPIIVVDHFTGQSGTAAEIGTLTFAADHTPGSPHGIWAAVDKAGSCAGNASQMLNVFRLGDNGIWAPTSLPPAEGGLPNYMNFQCGYDQSIGLSPTGAVYLGAVTAGGKNPYHGVFQSTDSGQRWSAIDEGTNGVNPHTDHHAWVFEGQTIFDGNDGGVFRFDPLPGNAAGRSTWTSLNGSNLQIAQVNSAALHPINKDLCLAGSQDNGVIFRSGGKWKNVHVYGDAGEVRFDGSMNAKSGSAYSVGPPAPLFFARSDSLGDDPWHDKSVTGNNHIGWYSPFTVNATDPARVLVGLNQLYESMNRGDTWSAISPPLNGTTLIVASAYGTDPHLIYTAYTDGKIFRTSTGGGQSGWQRIDNGINWGGEITDLQIDDQDPNSVYVVSSGGRAWSSGNRGGNWIEITGNMPSIQINKMAVVHRPSTSDPWVILATDVGAYAGIPQNNLTTWSPFGNGLPDVAVRDVQRYALSPSRIVVATFGRGVFATSLYDEIRPTVTDVLGQFQGVTGVAAYYAPSDGYQHVIVATADGSLQEVYFKGGGQPKTTDLLGQFQGVTGVAAYYAPSDGYQHVIVATADGSLQEVYFKGGGQPKTTDLLGQFQGVTGVAAYYAPSDGYQHVIVATADGSLQEVYFKGGGQPKTTDLLGQFQGVTGVAAYYAPSDGYQHVIVATADGSLQEVYFKGGGQPKTTDLLGQFQGVTGVAAYYAPSDGYQHVIVATADGSLQEVYFKGGGQPKTTGILGQFGGMISLAGYYGGADQLDHNIVASSDGTVRELYNLK